MPARVWHRKRMGSHYYNGKRISRGRRKTSKLYKGMNVDFKALAEAFKRIERS